MNVNMISKNQKHALLRSLLSNSLPVLCKNGLGLPDVQFSLEAFVGITVGEGEEVILVSIKETVTSEGVNISHSWNDPLEECTKSSTSIKKEVLCQEIFHNEPDVCDLTEEHDGTDEAPESDDKTFQRLSRTDDDHFAASAWTSADGSTDAEMFVKKEPPPYSATGSALGDEEMNGEEEDEDEEEEEEDDRSYPANFTPYQRVEASGRGSRREGFSSLRPRRAGRARFVQRGRLGGFPGRPWHPPAARGKHLSAYRKQQQQPNVHDGSTSRGNSVITHLDADDGSYRDLMKEMCQQVVSQSMSVETQYVCHICQARRCNKSSLMDHIRGTHLAMDKYTCGACGERFRWFMQLHRHRKKFHPEHGDEEIGSSTAAGGPGEAPWNV